MHATSRDQIDAAIAALAEALGAAEAANTEIATRLAGLMPLAVTLVDIVRTLAGEWSDDAAGELLFWSEATQRSMESWRRDVMQTQGSSDALKQRLAAIEATARAMAEGMQFGFLLDPQRRLLSIGCTADGALDSNCYDLLASEARLASFIAIAKNDIPARHWFRLGRSVTPIGRGAALISWSGSMFEYLMPSLVMRAPAGSLLEQTSRLIVRAADPLWRRARYSVGYFRIRLQCARPRAYLPVFKFRCPRPGAQTRPARERRRRALRHGACRHGRSGKRGAQFRETRRYRRAWPIRLS